VYAYICVCMCICEHMDVAHVSLHRAHALNFRHYLKPSTFKYVCMYMHVFLTMCVCMYI